MSSPFLLLHADDRAVFRFKGSNSQQSIEGILVLNTNVNPTGAPPALSFEAPVEALFYILSDDSAEPARFIFTDANPNSLVITKGADGSTSFLLVVNHAPTDPPFPGPPAFTMEFSFPGAAPWGDRVPDRTVVGARNVRLGAADLYDQSVSIVEPNRELAGIEAELRRLEAGFAAQFKNPGFTLPGATTADRVAAVTMGLDQLSTGARKQVYNFWRGAP